MDNQVLNFIEKLNLYTEIKKIVLKNFEINNKNIVVESMDAYDGDDFNFNICKVSDLDKICIILNLLPKFYNAYKQIGVSDKIIFDTFDDISLRANLYYEKYNKTGLTQDDVIWFRHINNVNIFKIGCLQFQPFKMIYLDKETIGEDYMTFDEKIKRDLPPDTPVINCHIQAGAKITKEEIDESFIESKKFFSSIVKDDYEAYLCYSWLLYPKMNYLLDESSNIKYFYKNFKIISSCNDIEQAKENIVNNTRLSRLFESNSKNFGYACGIKKI